MTDALFVPDGDRMVPTELSRGPWDPKALHGGPPAALLARSVEKLAGDDGLRVVRLGVELMRPIPLEPLLVDTAVIRSGRRIQLVDATVRVAATGVEVASARALRMRSAEVPLPHRDPSLGPLLAREPPFRGPDGYARARPLFEDAGVAFARDSIDIRFVEGDWFVPGPVALWGRLLPRVVPDEEPSPLQRTVALADMGNGVSWVVGFETHTFINPDLTVHLWHYPPDEWIGIRVATRYGDDGIGAAEAELYGRDGRIGRAVQSVIVDAR